jgi:hypothetical protein
MGLDRFANFISKSINNEGIEELNIENNIRKIVSTHIIFDLNFLIYQEIVEIENEINDVIKIILCLPFALDNNEILETLLKNIFTQPHWKPYYVGTDLENIFDGFNEDEIINKFLFYIGSKITSPNTEYNNGLTIIELVIYEKIINTMIHYVDSIHSINFIQSLSVFFDGIPSMSKIIEQRRRRIKNYLESSEKKILFKKYFDNLIPNNKNIFESLSKQYNPLISNEISTKQINHTIYFDYFKWIKSRFSVDKSIGPSSNFIKNLELFMNIKLQKNFSKIKLYINSAGENGESDLKIFKYIAQNEMSGDYCIHTTDSDLVHQMLVQQTHYKILNKDINLNVVKYLKNYNLIGYVQILDANLIIKNIMDLYNNVNNTKTNNYKIIWDLCWIFFLFGNDHVPSSVEIGPELGLDFFMKRHYQSLGKSNIITIKKSYIAIDLKNLLLFFQKIHSTNTANVTRILLQRFFKININLINLFVDKLNWNFNDILLFLNNFTKWIGQNMDPVEYTQLIPDDLRISNNPSNTVDKSPNMLKLDEIKTKIILDNLKLITDNIDFCEKDFNGLILYNKPLNITTDPYQDLYNYVSDKANCNLSKLYPNLYDHIDVYEHLKLINELDNTTQTTQSNDYIKKIYHLTITQFGNMKDYHTDNLTWYKYYSAPSINNIINYLSSIDNDNNKPTKKWLKEIKEDDILTENYLNSINHHLIITPFISHYTLPEDIKKIISEIEPIDNLWLNDSFTNFNYRDIDIKKFFKLWSDALIRINLSNKTTKINEELINLNLEFI